MRTIANSCRLKCLLAEATFAFLAASAMGAVEQDILFSYAPSYSASLGGEANAQVSFANVAAAVNFLYDQSGAGARWHIAGYYQSINDPLNFTTTGGMVGWLSGNNANVSDVVSYGSTVGADLVLYVVQNSDSSSIAGVTQQPGMYSSINPGNIWSGVVAHEIGGHAYGGNHQDGHIGPSGPPKTIMMHNYCVGGGATPPYFFSNPNIWWNGVQLLGNGQTCLGGSQVNGGDNTYCLSANAQGVTDRRERPVIGPVLTNMVLHWCFTNTPGTAPAGTTNYDLVSGAPAVVRGNGATYTGSALRIPGGTTGNVAMSSMAAYIDLPNYILSSQTNITIEIWATPLSAPNWARIMDFGRCTNAGDGLGAPGEFTGNPSDPAPGATAQSDGLTLTACIGTDITQQRFESPHNGFVVTADANLATTPGVQHYYAITFTDGAGSFGTNGGRWEWFRDGDPVTFLDVSNHLASIQDVNDWLGHSEWSADSLANNDYSEVRISNVAMSREQVAANYSLGPNFNISNTTMMTANDEWAGSTRSFNTAGNWSDGLAPSTGKNYDLFDFNLITPNTTTPFTFAGSSLRGNGGIFFCGSSGTTTINVPSFTVENEEICNGTTASGSTFNLAGNLNVNGNNVVRGSTGPINLAANLSGNGSITLYGNTATITGNNANYTGKLRIGNGIIGSLRLSSEAQLGANPPVFTPDQLILNRGWLYTAGNFSISNSNRGILIGVNDGIFDVAIGTTLTLGSQLSSGMTLTSATQLSTQAEQSGVVAGALIKQDSGTLILNSPNSGFTGALDVDSASSTANDGAVRIANSSVMANAYSPIFIRDSGSARSTLQLDGTLTSILLPQNISLNGRNNVVPAIENLAGTNTLSGGISTYGTGSYVVQVDSGILNIGGIITSSDNGSDTITFQGNGAVNLNSTLTGPMSVNKSGNGTLAFGAGSTYSGSTVVNQGTLALQPSTLPVLHLTFNNAAGSGNGAVITNTGTGGAAMNGTLVSSGGASIAAGGRFGNALSLNGTGSNTSNNIVLIPNKVLNTDASGSWTVGYWIKTTTTGAVVMYQGDGAWSSAGQTTFYLNSSNTTSGTRAGAVRWAGGWLTGTAALNNNAWHFVALVDNAGTEKIYVDGNLDTVASTMANPLSSDANQIWIGGSPDSGDGTAKMNGLIDDVYMFNRALSQAEVQSLFVNNTITNASVNTLPAATPVTVASTGILDLAGVSQTIASLSGSGLVTNTGGPATLTLSNSSGTTTFSGIIGDFSAANALSLVQSGGSTTILSGVNTYRGATTVNGGTLLVNGAIGSGAVTVNNNGTLGGHGTISGALTVQAGGALLPGGALTVLTVNNNVTLQPGSTTVLEISKTPQTNDQLVVAGALTYGGTLIVTNLSGTLAAGDAFQLFEAGSTSGTFNSNSLPSLSPGLAWNTSNLSSGVISIVQTTPANIVWNVTGTNLGISWPAGYVGWRLQVQTDSVAGTNWVDVPGSSSTNYEVLPVDPTVQSMFYRLIYP